MPFPQWINKVILYFVEKSEPRSCVKVKVDILGCDSQDGHPGLWQSRWTSWAVTVEVDILGCDSQGGHPGLWQSRWTSWAVTVKVDILGCDSRGGHPGLWQSRWTSWAVTVKVDILGCDSQGGHPGLWQSRWTSWAVTVKMDILGSPSLIVCTLCGHKATLNSSSCRRYWTPVFFCFFIILFLFLFFTHVDDGLLDYTELFCTCFRTRTRPRRCRRPGSRWSSGWMRDGSWQGYPVLMQKVRFLLLWYADYYTAFSAFMVY